MLACCVLPLQGNGYDWITLPRATPSVSNIRPLWGLSLLRCKLEHQISSFKDILDHHEFCTEPKRHEGELRIIIIYADR